MLNKTEKQILVECIKDLLKLQLELVKHGGQDTVAESVTEKVINKLERLLDD